MRPTDIETAVVWRDQTRVGTIRRSRAGSVFEYDPDFYVENRSKPGGIATHLPYGQRVHETRGVNLHPYFDRKWSSSEQRMRTIHQEDGCQFLNRYPADKYRISCREIAEGIAEYTLAPVPEMARFLRLVAKKTSHLRHTMEKRLGDLA